MLEQPECICWERFLLPAKSLYKQIIGSFALPPCTTCGITTGLDTYKIIDLKH